MLTLIAFTLTVLVVAAAYTVWNETKSVAPVNPFEAMRAAEAASDAPLDATMIWEAK